MRRFLRFLKSKLNFLTDQWNLINKFPKEAAAENNVRLSWKNTKHERIRFYSLRQTHNLNFIRLSIL